MQNYNTTMIGKIVEFFPETLTATVRLHMSEFAATKEIDCAPIDTPDLIDVPIHCPRCNGFAITMPIKPEDDCLVLFTQRGISHWLYNNEETYAVIGGRPDSAYRRTFSRANALAIVGFNNLEEPMLEYNSEDMELRNISAEGSTLIQKITLKSTGDITLATSTGGATASINMEAASGEVTINGVVFSPDGIMTVPTAIVSPSVKASGLELAFHKHVITSGSSAGFTEVNIDGP